MLFDVHPLVDSYGYLCVCKLEFGLAVMGLLVYLPPPYAYAYPRNDSTDCCWTVLVTITKFH